MIFTIKKGKHRAWPPRLGLFFNAKASRRSVTFQQGCSYWLEGEDMHDINKLFGLGFAPWWKGVLIMIVAALGGSILNNAHHKESARFGWRFDNGKNIIISIYCYINGIRTTRDICKVPMYKKAIFSIYVQKNDYVFTVILEGETLANVTVPKFHRFPWSFPLGLYFGGNHPAPQNMRVEMKRL